MNRGFRCIYAPYTFQVAWPHVVNHIEDEAVDVSHSKLSWYQDQYEDTTKNIKALEEKLSSERDHHHKAETKQSKLETELENPQLEVKFLGKHKPSPVSHKWHKWESKLDSGQVE